MEKEIIGKLCKKISKKGNEYYCVEVQITPTYKAMFFPNKAEVELLNIALNGNSIKSTFNTDSGNNDVFADFK